MLDTFRQSLAEHGAVSFSVRARPGAHATRVTDILEDGSVKIAIAAPAEEGKANAELIRFLSEEFGVPRGNVSVVVGGGGRKKIVRIARS